MAPSDKSLAIKDEFTDWERHNSLVYRSLPPELTKKETDRLTDNHGAFKVDNESLIITKCLTLEEGQSILDMYSHIHSTTMLLLQSTLQHQLRYVV